MDGERLADHRLGPTVRLVADASVAAKGEPSSGRHVLELLGGQLGRRTRRQEEPGPTTTVAENANAASRSAIVALLRRLGVAQER
jgi:hypothetical protein